MDEEHDPSRLIGPGENARQSDLTGRDGNPALTRGGRNHAVTRDPGSAWRRQRITSASVVGAKSRYQDPTAWKFAGDSRHTTSSTMPRSASAPSGEQTGAAKMIWRGRCRRMDFIAAWALAPVARPSSTRITVRPSAWSGGRLSR